MCVPIYTLPMGAKRFSREAAAEACVEILDTTFFKALCEPARVALLKQLVLKGRSDVGTLASAVPQDRSVVARHLQVMGRAGLVTVAVEGRNTFYEIDAVGILERMEQITGLVRQLSTICCPAQGD